MRLRRLREYGEHERLTKWCQRLYAFAIVLSEFVDKDL
jgi:hypothetical protein